MPQLFSWKSARKTGLLLVEDDDSIISTLVLRWVASAEEAKQVLKESPIDVVLTDFLLKGKANGGDLLKHCQKHHAGVLVIVLSGLSFKTIQGISEGLPENVDYLAKPFRVTEAKTLIQEVLCR